MTSELNASSLRLEYSIASDGPRITLFGTMSADIDVLQSVFKRLSHADETIRLDREPFIIPVGGIQIEAVRATHNRGLRRTDLFLPYFAWTLSEDEWDDIVELITGFHESHLPGHHYLTRLPTDEATVVLSKGEITLNDFS